MDVLSCFDIVSWYCILGNAKSNPPPNLLIQGKKIELVSSFKLLGVHISDDFRWESHINAVCSKVSSRLSSSNGSNGQEFPLMIYCISTLLSFGQCLNTHVLFGITISRHRSQINYIAETGTTTNSWWFCGWKVLRILNILFKNWTFVWKKNNHRQDFRQ